MGYRNFKIQCTVRVLVLAATNLLLFYLLFQNSPMPLVIIAGAAILYEVYSLIGYVGKTNRDLTRFLEAVKHEDFSQTFTGAGMGKSFSQLKTAFNAVLSKFRQTRAETEEHYRYLQTVVQHVGTGLLSFQKNGEVELINTAAKRLLRVTHLKNIRSLEPFSKELVEALLRLRPGEKVLVRVRDNEDLLHYVIQATEFIMREHKYTLVSIQNIQSELEEKEMEAWQRLIRVLTHEIMNSITPISSLASTANEMLMPKTGIDGSPEKIDSETIGDVRSAVQTIENRSQGLLHFVESYRKLTRIPKPNFQIFTAASLFERVSRLMSPQLGEKSISFASAAEPETLELTADPELIEQVLINLIVNSMQALEGHMSPRIEMRASMDARGRVVVRVIDNGPGILDEVQDKIFIPFFTTKKNGTGIGLSLCQQIMRLHRGTITVHSKPNEQTVLSLKF
ncbi:MAG: ATP-binding protein [Bacteroidota bacterium]|jgi:nitrogen fixation/metabolism regulation signal transduction histidine kinase